jgi:hypothetical protein
VAGAISVDGRPTLKEVRMEITDDDDNITRVVKRDCVSPTREEFKIVDTGTAPLVDNDGPKVPVVTGSIAADEGPGTASYIIVMLVRSRVGKMAVF